MSGRAAVVVTMTVTIDVGDQWGPECTIRQVQAQASTAARARLERVLDGQSGISLGPVTATRVVVVEETGR